MQYLVNTHMDMLGIQMNGCMFYTNGYYYMDMADTNANIKAINGSLFVTSDGYCGAQSINMNMNMDMDITVSGETVAADMSIYIGYINPGQSVDFTLPSTEGFIEAS